MNNFSCLTAFLIGFLGSAHCFGMCGGIVVAVSMSLNNLQHKFLYQILFNIGRILSYVLICLFVSFLGSFLFNIESKAAFIFIKLGSNIILILLSLYLLNLFKWLYFIENILFKLWKTFYPIIKKINIKKKPANIFFLGLLWGNLPCGLVYSTLAWCVGSSNTIKEAGILMFFFGCGTIPSMLLTFVLTNKIKNYIYNTIFKYITATCIMLFALYNISMIFITKNCH